MNAQNLTIFLRTNLLYLHVQLAIVMDTKLTLKLDKNVIEKAKEYAASHKRSLSAIIESYLQSLTGIDETENIEEIEITPFVKSMSSRVKIPADFDYKKEYRSHLEEKYK